VVESSKPLDPVLMKKCEAVWKGVGKAVTPGAPALVKRFVGRNAGKKLLGHPEEAWHQAVVYALSGENAALVQVMRGATLRVAADYPESTRYLYEGAQVFRWASARAGLLGWAEVWDVPVPGKKKHMQPFTLGDRGGEMWLAPETDREFRTEYGTSEVKSGFRSSTDSDAGGVNRMAEALERAVIGLRDPYMNNVGLPESRLLELIDFYARMIRMWMDLPQEQPTPKPDFTVDLPPEFQGFGPRLVD